jgi:chemotaxis protein histidine kinase CheA
MTEQEIKLKSKEELQEIVVKFYESPYIKPYLATQHQLDNLSGQIESANIRFDDEDKLFDAFLKWSDKIEKITDSLENIKQKIDKDALIQAKRKKLGATEGQLESFVKNRL